MKRALFLLGGGLLLGPAAHAQFGLRVGGSVTAFTKGTDQQSEGTTLRRRLGGYQAGLYYQAALTKRLALVPEVQFSRERFWVSKNTSFFEGSVASIYDQSLSYLTMPVLLRLAVGAAYVEAGPQASLLVGGRAVGSQSQYSAIGRTTDYFAIDQSARDSYRHVDAGPCVGVGLQLPAGLGLGVRAYWGLTRLADGTGASVFSQTYANFQHRHTLQASLTYQLRGRS